MIMYRETCCLYNNTMYPVDTLIDTVVTSDNCTQVWKNCHHLDINKVWT